MQENQLVVRGGGLWFVACFCRVRTGSAFEIPPVYMGGATSPHAPVLLSSLARAGSLLRAHVVFPVFLNQGIAPLLDFVLQNFKNSLAVGRVLKNEIFKQQ